MVKDGSESKGGDLFQSIVREVSATMNLPACIWVLDEDAEALKIAGAVGLRPAYVEEAILRPDEPSVTGEAFKTGETLAVSDVTRDPRWKYKDEAKEMGWKSALAIPLKLRGKVIGVISVYTFVERVFSPLERELLGHYASQVEIALQRVRERETLEKLIQIGHSIEEIVAERPVLVLEQIVKGACDITGADCAVIYPYDPLRKEFYDVSMVVAHGLRKRLRLTEKPRTTSGMAAYVKSEGEVIVNDIERESPEMLESPFIARESVKAFMGFSLKVGEEIVGILYIDFREPHMFSKEEKNTARLFAHQASIAIYNTRLYEQARSRAEALTRLSEIGESLVSIQDSPQILEATLKRIAESAQKVLDADLVDLYQYIQAQDRFLLPPIMIGKRKHRAVPMKMHDDNVVVRIVHEGESQYFEAAQSASLLSSEFETLHEGAMEQRFVIREGIQSSAAIPLKIGDETVGMMFVNYRKPLLFTDERRERIELFANQAAIAIQNARLFEEVRDRADEVSLLQQVSAQISTTLKLDEILPLLVEGAMRLTKTESGVVHVIDSSGERILASYGYPEEFNHPSPRILEEGYTCLIVQGKKQQVVGDAQTDELANPEIKGKGVRSFVGTPLKLGGERVMGVLYVNDTSVRQFTQEELSLLRTLADQAAIAIYNSRLYQEARTRAEALKRLHEVNPALVSISAAPGGLADILTQIAQNAQSVLGADLVDLYQYVQSRDEYVLPPIQVGERYDPSVRKDKIYEDDVIWAPIKGKQPRYVPEAQQEPGLIRPFSVKRPDVPTERFVTREGVKSSAAVPLMVGTEVVGVLFANYRSPQTFTPQQRELIELFASQAAIAIRNARSYEQRVQDVLALVEINKAILSQDPGAVTQLIADKAVELTRADYCVLRLVDSSGQYLILEASSGRESRKDPLPIDGNSFTGWVASQRKAELCSDVSQADHYLKWYPDVQSCMAAPLMHRQSLIGTLYVESTQLNAFSEVSQLDLLQSFADQAAIAIENARLFQALEERARRLVRLQEVTATISSAPSDLDKVLLLIVDSLTDIFWEASCAIRLYDLEKDEFGPRVAAGKLKDRVDLPPRPDGTSWYVARTRASLYVEDTSLMPSDEEPAVRQETVEQGVKAVAYLPLCIKEDVIGILYVDLTEPHHFSRHDRQILELFADQAAIAIENLRLYDQRSKDIAALKEINEAVVSKELAEILQLVVDKAVEVMPGEYCSLWLREPDSGDLVLEAVHMPKGATIQEVGRLKAGEASISKRVVETGKPNICEDVEKDNGFYRIYQAAKSSVTVPLKYRGRVIGVLNVESPRLGAFTDQHSELLDSFADQAAIAIENARLYAEERRKAEQLGRLNKVGAAMTQVTWEEPSLEKVLHEILASIDTVLGEKTTSCISLYDRQRRSFDKRIASGPLYDHLFASPPRPDGTGSYVVRTKQSLFVDDVSDKRGAHPNIRKETIAQGVKSFAVLPLSVKEGLVGTLYVYLLKLYHFSEETRNVLETFADQAAIAIENARLFEQLQEELRRTEALSQIGGALAALEQEF